MNHLSAVADCGSSFAPPLLARLDHMLDHIHPCPDGQLRIGDNWRFVMAAGSIEQAPDHRDSAIERELAYILYACCYARDLAHCLSPRRLQTILAFDRPGTEEPGLVKNLLAAHPGQTRWDTGWIAYRVDPNGTVHAAKGDLHRVCPPGSYVTEGGKDRRPQKDDPVQILLRGHATDLQPGALILNGDSPASHYDDMAQSRLYLHINMHKWPEILRDLANRLNRFVIPFRIKCQIWQRNLDRCDGVVLYVARRHMPMALRILAEIHRVHARHFIPAVPLFAKMLAPGIGGAEDAGDGESFGLQRMQIVATALMDAARHNAQGRDARRAFIYRHFTARHIRPDAPHIHPGNCDLMFWPNGPRP